MAIPRQESSRPSCEDRVSALLDLAGAMKIKDKNFADFLMALQIHPQWLAEYFADGSSIMLKFADKKSAQASMSLLVNSESHAGSEISWFKYGDGEWYLVISW